MATRTPGAQQRDNYQRNWGNYATPGVLPNTPGFVAPVNILDPLEAGDTAYVTSTSAEYLCTNPGAPGAGNAIWVLNSNAGYTEVWNLNGLIAAFAPEPAPGAFNGLPVTDPSLAGPGPFDGTRFVFMPGTIMLVEATLRVPPAVLTATIFEVYRIRAGVVTSIALFALAATAPNNFTAISGVPVPNDVLTGDMIFVALATPGPALAADLSVTMRVLP